MVKPIQIDDEVYIRLCRFRDLLHLSSLSRAIDVLLIVKVDDVDLAAMFGS